MHVLLVITGLMAGIYFVFSIVVMPVLAKLPGLRGAETMNAINTKIVKTIFLPLFFVSTAMHVWFAIAQVTEGVGFRSLVFWAALIYILGMFVITLCANVPLNKRLHAAVLSNDSSVHELWLTYLKWWVRFNHIRTWSCAVSAALLALALPQP